MSHGHETTSAPASTASTVTRGPIAAAFSRRRSPCPKSATQERCPALSPSAQSRTRQRRPAFPRLPPGVAGNSNPAEPENIVTTNRLLLACQVYCSTFCGIAVLLYWVRPWVDVVWVVRGWWVAARSFPEMAEYRQTKNPRLFPVSYKVLKNQLTAPRVQGVLLYVLLHCCTAVCSKGLVGGWVEGALRRPWWVDGPFRTWESFFVLWEMNLDFFFFPVILPASLVLGSTTVPTAALP